MVRTLRHGKDIRVRGSNGWEDSRIIGHYLVTPLYELYHFMYRRLWDYPSKNATTAGDRTTARVTFGCVGYLRASAQENNELPMDPY